VTARDSAKFRDSTDVYSDFSDCFICFFLFFFWGGLYIWLFFGIWCTVLRSSQWIHWFYGLFIGDCSMASLFIGFIRFQGYGAFWTLFGCMNPQCMALAREEAIGNVKPTSDGRADRIARSIISTHDGLILHGEFALW